MPAIAKNNFTQVLSMAVAIIDSNNRMVRAFSLINPFDHIPKPKLTVLMTIINLDSRFPNEEPSLLINFNKCIFKTTSRTFGNELITFLATLLTFVFFYFLTCFRI